MRLPLGNHIEVKNMYLLGVLLEMGFESVNGFPGNIL